MGLDNRRLNYSVMYSRRVCYDTIGSWDSLINVGVVGDRDERLTSAVGKGKRCSTDLVHLQSAVHIVRGQTV